jgi:septal ring factor EnvC (AmiA/AmiB activator)
MCWRERTKSSDDFGSPILDFGLMERKRMNEKSCLRVLNFVAGSLVFSGAIVHADDRDRQELKNDRAEIRSDKRELRNDRKELQKDRRELKKDLRQGARPAEINQDREDLRGDRRELKHDLRELKGDQRELRHDRHG